MNDSVSQHSGILGLELRKNSNFDIYDASDEGHQHQPGWFCGDDFTGPVYFPLEYVQECVYAL